MRISNRMRPRSVRELHSEYEMKKTKAEYKTVQVEAQVVNSDGVPVNGRGVEYGRGWRKNVELVKRRYKIEWATVTDGRYATRDGSLACTYDKSEAKSWPDAIPGARVVDAEEFVKEFNNSGSS